jgi:dihydrofolate synthase/folylpolyglutamate synthase
MELNERIQLDGLPCSDGVLVDAIEAVDRARWDWARRAGIQGTPLTYFEYMIAAAFVAFRRAAVEVMVVEVGLGGRLDATNVVTPVVCAVPSIGLDHQEQLGETLAEIAGEKAGIFKRGVPVVAGPLAPDARAVLQARCRALGCELWMPPELRREAVGQGWRLSTPLGSLADVRLKLEGQHQAANAGVALGVLHRLRDLGFLITDDAMRTGFATAAPPARLERLHAKLIVDGAHNAPGAEALAAWLGKQPRPASRILLLGMGAGRDPVPLVRALLPHVDEVVTTQCTHPHARDPMELALQLNQSLDATLSAGEAIEKTLPEVLAEADEVVVAGSLFVAGAARSLVLSGAVKLG